MSRAVRIQLVERFDDLPIDGAAWNDLVSQSETNTVFQTYEWFSSWCHVFGNRHALWLLLAFTGEQLVGIVPLARTGRTIRFASERYADYCDVIAGQHKEAVVQALLAFLADRRDTWSALSLQNLPGNSSTPALLKRLAPSAGLRLLVRGTVACPAAILDGTSETSEALLRKDSLKRPYHFFRRSGHLVFRNAADVETALSLLPQFFAQHVKRWRRDRRPSLFLDAENCRFYSELVRRLLPRGWLVLSIVEYNREPIAFHLGFDYGEAFLWYKPSFDVHFERRSPGNVMLRFLIEQALANGKKKFDFTVGDEPFKKRYSSTVQYNTNILITAGLGSYASSVVIIAAKRLARRLLGRAS